MKKLRSMAVLAAAGGLVLGSTRMMLGQGGQRGGGGQGSQTQLGAPLPTLNGASGADDAARDRTNNMEEEQAKSRNLERQRKLVSDTAMLLQLATELQKDVDKTTKDTMSLDVIRKADEIEKLAHSVKDRMKGS